MKITRNKLRELILEEITRARLSESRPVPMPGAPAPERQMGPYPAGTVFRISFDYSDGVISVYTISGAVQDDPGVYVDDFDTIAELINWIDTQSEEAVYYMVQDLPRAREMNPVQLKGRLEMMRSAFEKFSS